MARRSLFNDVVYYGVVGFLGYSGYKLVLDGKFGAAAKKAAEDLRDALGGSGDGDTGKLPPPRAFYPPISCVGDLQEIKRVNPNITWQMPLWQSERNAKGEDPYDWPAFRKHITTPQGPNDPDPGAAPPTFFCNWRPTV